MTKRIGLMTAALAAAFLLLASGYRAAVQAADPAAQTLAAGGTAFSYQGYLTEGGAPAEGDYDFKFELYDSQTEPGTLLGVEELEDVPISGGLFNVQLDFGGPVFDGDARWLAISLRPGSEAGEYTPLEGRQPITPTPYALYASQAGAIDWSAIENRPSGLDDGDDDSTYTAGTGLTLAAGQFNVLTTTIQQRVAQACGEGYAIRQVNADGSVVCQQAGLTASFWSLSGNTGTSPESNFLGTTDTVSLTLAVNNTPALRLAPTAGTPNLLGGYSGNQASLGVIGAFIGGGGADGWASHLVSDNYGTLGGGYGNQAGDGDSNPSNRVYATVAGGADNTASGASSFVGGGESNTASGSSAVVAGGASNQANANNATIGGGGENAALGYAATIAGGESNTIENDWGTIAGGYWNQNNGDYGTIGGGHHNTINANLGTIPGGSSNTVNEDYGFAAGRRAIANHQGAFVWADSTDADYASLVPNQFSVRASGGVRFTTNGADFQIDNAQVWTEANDGAGSALDADLLDGLQGSDYQRRVTGTCTTGSVVVAVNADGSVDCENDADTTYGAGYGLELDGSQFSVMTDTIQVRVSEGCIVGSTIREINVDGSVVCQPNDPLNRAALPQLNQVTTLDSEWVMGGTEWRTAATIGVDGLVLISYNDYSWGNLMVAHCEDIECASFTLSAVDTVDNVGRSTALIIGSDGLGLVSYRDFTHTALKVAHCDDVPCTTVSATILDNSADVGYYSSIGIAGDGLALISYQDLTNGTLKVAHCEDTLCTAATITTLDNSWQQTSLAIGTDGLGLIAYRNDTGNGLKVAHCNDLDCTTATLTVLDTTTGSMGAYASVTIGIDGLGLISYFDQDSGSLKVAHCENVACTTATTSFIDGGYAGYYSSITIGQDGLGVISYQKSDNLKFAHCNDLACTSASTVGLDAVGTAGNGSSVTIGVDGNPFVSYYEIDADDLKVVHCSNAFCAPYWQRR